MHASGPASGTGHAEMKDFILVPKVLLVSEQGLDWLKLKKLWEYGLGVANDSNPWAKPSSPSVLANQVLLERRLPICVDSHAPMVETSSLKYYRDI